MADFKTIELFPPNLREDKNIQAFAGILDKIFSELTEQDLQKLFVYAIDSQPEEVLDWLAWQFHVEGYDLAKTVEEKRNFVKNAIELHRYKGTKYAVKKVLSTLNLGGEVKEWFEYGGEPYRFKLDLFFEELIKHGITLTPEVQDKLIELINNYKNERSHLEELRFNVFFENEQKIAASSKLSTFTKADFEQPSVKEISMNQDGEYKILSIGLSPVTATKADFEQPATKELSPISDISVFATAKEVAVMKAEFESTEVKTNFQQDVSVITSPIQTFGFLILEFTGEG